MKLCSITTCNNQFLAKGLCSKHYYRLKRGQDVLGKSRFDRRPATIVNGICYIELASQKGHFFVDIADKSVDEYNWSLSGDGYPMTWVDGKLIKAHHLIFGKPSDGMYIDHKNRDRMDNRRSNLREVTPTINGINKRLQSNNSSGITGVTYDKQKKKWMAQMHINGKHIFIGYYDDIQSAANARRERELKEPLFIESNN